MCQKNHIVDPATQAPLRFTCHNAWFETSIGHGEPHDPDPTRGSVFRDYLARDPNIGNTLWLEYARDHRTGYDELFWLIWYDTAGCPLTVASAVFDRSAVKELVRKLSEFIVIP